MLQLALLRPFFEALDLITNFEILPTFKRNATFRVLPHFRDILLPILQRSKSPYRRVSIASLQNMNFHITMVLTSIDDILAPQNADFVAYRYHAIPDPASGDFDEMPLVIVDAEWLEHLSLASDSLMR